MTEINIFRHIHENMNSPFSKYQNLPCIDPKAVA